MPGKRAGKRIKNEIELLSSEDESHDTLYTKWHKSDFVQDLLQSEYEDSSNSSELYNGDKIDKLLKLQIPEDEATVKYPFTIHKTKAFKNFIARNVDEVIKNGTPIVLPLNQPYKNVENSWVGAIIRKKDNGKIEFIYNNPKGTNLTTNNQKVVKQALNEKTNGNFEYFNLSVYQLDSSTVNQESAPTVIDNLTKIVSYLISNKFGVSYTDDWKKATIFDPSKIRSFQEKILSSFDEFQTKKEAKKESEETLIESDILNDVKQNKEMEESIQSELSQNENEIIEDIYDSWFQSELSKPYFEKDFGINSESTEIYDKKKVMKLLKLQIPEESANIEPAYNFEELKANIKTIINRVEEDGILTVIPVYFNRKSTKHSNKEIKEWAGCVIRKALNEKMQFFYNDPMGNALFSNTREVIQKALPKDASYIDIARKQLRYDMVECTGPITIDTLVAFSRCSKIRLDEGDWKHIKGYLKKTKILLSSHYADVDMPSVQLLKYLRGYQEDIMRTFDKFYDEKLEEAKKEIENEYLEQRIEFSTSQDNIIQEEESKEEKSKTQKENRPFDIFNDPWDISSGEEENIQSSIKEISLSGEDSDSKIWEDLYSE